MQQAQAASIAAGSIALAVVSVPAISEPWLALLGAAAGLVLLFGMDGRPCPRLAFFANAPGPSAVSPQSTVFLRERGSDSTDDDHVQSASGNGRPMDEMDEADEDQPTEPSDDDDHSAALSYEEFTARVAEEVETEEISFLPPYASGAGETARPDAGGTSEPWDLEDVDDAGRATADSRSKMPMPQHFALGTVAVIRKLLEPEDVERILAEQRRYPRLRFGDIAVQFGLLTESQLQELLLAQQQGVFTDAEIREARDRLRVFRKTGTAGKR
jgi:hypothetical protein